MAPSSQLLVKRGADPNARDAHGSSPLHVAAQEGDSATVEFLLASGANPSLCNTAGRTALELALTFADEEVELIDVLRQAQAKHDARLLTVAAPAARPKVQIVWECDPESAAAAGERALPASKTKDSSCGSDEADSTPAAAAIVADDDPAVRAARLAKWGIESTSSVAEAGALCGAVAALDLSDPAADGPAAARLPAEAGGSSSSSAGEQGAAIGPSAASEAIDAAALSSLADKLLAWE